jgi:hypothetical protein
MPAELKLVLDHPSNGVAKTCKRGHQYPGTHNCNNMLGRAKDSSVTLRNAADYLERN